MKLRWLAALAPFTMGLALDLALANGLRPLPVVFLRADLGSLALLAGLAFTILAGGWMVVNERIQEARHQAYVQAADERRRFLRRLDHELKNPLTAIRAGLVNLSEDLAQDASREALESVESQALRLSRLAGDLRKLAELETRPLERTLVDLGALLEETFAIAQDNPQADERKLTLTLPRAPWPLPKVSGDPDLLFLAVHNLLDNALKFTRPGDTVEVRAFEDGSNVVIEVADTGPGIPAEDLTHVWEELYRSQSAHGVPGSGLGLALVRAIAERHNGHVGLRSRHGQGTVLTIKLPTG